MAAPAARVQPFEVTVERVTDETPTVRTLRLRLPAGRSFDFIPGQFLLLHGVDAPKPERAYSIASSPGDAGSVEITLSQVGPLSADLYACKGGERFAAQGPYGRWRYDASIRDAVLIAGGTGISPFRSMWRSVIDRGLSNRLTLLYSAKCPSEVVYAAELRELAKRPRMKVFTTITRPETLRSGEAWRGPVGRLDIATVRRETPDFAAAQFFLCGSGPMVAGMTDELTAAGVGRERIHSEKWGEF